MAEGFGSSEQRPSLSGAAWWSLNPGVLKGAVTQCQPCSRSPGPGRGDCIWGEHSPNGFRTGECPTKAIPTEV